METIAFVVLIGILVFSVILHELGHAWVALKLGDTTAYRLGRLTLNPISHIDPFMTIILPGVLYLSTGMIFGGAKPVPVQPANFTHVAPRKGMMLVAVAGPLVNFSLALVMALVAKMLNSMGMLTDFVLSILAGSILLNISLGLFNMVPIPPLDGSKVIGGLIPKDMAYRYLSLERFGFFVLLVVIYFDGLDPLYNLTKSLTLLLLQMS